MRISDWSSDVCSSDLGLAGRYAVALFDLARESNAINAVLKSLGDLKAGLAESADLHTLVTSPIVGRTDAANAIGAVAKAMTLDSLTTKFLGLLAANRRLADLPGLIDALAAIVPAPPAQVTRKDHPAHPP